MRDIVRKLKRKLKPADTEERCGLILKNGTVFQTPNVHPDPQVGFQIPGCDLVTNEAELLGTWHTHPGKTSVYSMEDHTGFMNWPQLTHFIVGADGVRAYRAEDGIMREVDLASD
jgi:proteasome lid subunit RPN8/RPN11